MKIPLAHYLKPRTLDEIIGQDEIVGKDSFLRKAIERDKLPSMIFYGPPGCGKTSLASVISLMTNSEFKVMNAVSAGIGDLRKVIKEAEENLNSIFQKRTILFIDEIHRFNKKQQDFLLPYVEDGTIILIGATTENPSFEVNSALLSRSQVVIFRTLEKEDILKILKQGQAKILKIKEAKKGIEENILKIIAEYSKGDSRFAWNIYELLLEEIKNGERVDKELVKSLIKNKALLYDKNGQEHYNIISALHKSMRNSDPDAAAY